MNDPNHPPPSGTPPGSPYPPVPYQARPSGYNQAFWWVGGGCAVMAGLFLLLLVLAIIGSETGLLGLIIGMIVALMPVPIYIMLALWLDRIEAEPPWMLAVAFFWGASVSVFVSLLFNTINAAIAASLFGPELGSVLGAVISAPIFEEGSKALILIIFYFARKDEFDGIVDGIVYATMVALGFAMVENFLYYGRAIAGEGGAVALTITFIMRGIVGPFAHPLFTSMTGIGLGWSRQTKNPAIRVVAPFVGLGMAMFLHGLWNLSASIHGLLYIAVYILFMVPALLIVLGVVAYSLKQEGAILRQHLQPEVQSGLMTPAEVIQISGVLSRLQSSLQALARGGFGRWRTQTLYYQIASELAFHRWRIEHGTQKADYTAAERERAYLQQLQALRSRLA